MLYFLIAHIIVPLFIGLLIGVAYAKYQIRKRKNDELISKPSTLPKSNWSHFKLNVKNLTYKLSVLPKEHWLA